MKKSAKPKPSAKPSTKSEPKPSKPKPSTKPEPSPEITEYQAIATLTWLGYIFTSIKPKRDRLTTGINLRTGVTRQLVAVKLYAPIESEYGAMWAKHYAKKDT